MSDAILEVVDLRMYIHSKRHKKFLRIVDGVSLEVNASEILGIFGESGSGKSSVAYSIMGLTPEKPGIISGEIYLRDASGEYNLTAGLADVCDIDTTRPGQFIIRKNVKAWRKQYKKLMKNIRGSKIALIPQDAKTALWPFGTIEQQLRKAYQSNGGQLEDSEGPIEEILMRLRLSEIAHKYPHELSGGACQRAIIGLTMVLDPTVIIADEPTTGLDTTLQVDIVKLLDEFRLGKLAHQVTSSSESKQRALVVISHDLRVMKNLADKIMVMYAGEVVESGSSALISQKKVMHPYTRQLLDIADVRAGTDQYNPGKLHIIEGEVPALLDPPSGCKFYDRCSIHTEICAVENPIFFDVNGEPGHKVKCHVVANSRRSRAVA